VALTNSEAKPHSLRISARDETIAQYEAHHVLSRAGRFAVNAMLNGKLIEACPLRFTVVGGRASGLKSRLLVIAQAETDQRSTNFSSASGAAAVGGERAGAPVPAMLVGKPFRLEVRARDRFGNAVYHGGASVEVKVVEPPVEPGSEADHVLAPKLEYVVRDNETGVYYIDVTAAQPGRHTMTVRLDGAEVIGSPLDLDAARPRVLASVKAAGKSRGETLYAVASAIANAGINWAFKTWADWSLERRARLDYLAYCAGHIKNADLRDLFVTWKQVSLAFQEARKELRKVLNAIHKQLCRRSLNSWIAFAEERSYNVALLNRVLGTLSNFKISRAFNSWIHHLYGPRTTPRTTDDHADDHADDEEHDDDVDDDAVDEDEGEEEDETT